MNDILYRAAAYLLIIALGVFLKKVGFFHERDFRTLAKILLNITLPCAIIYSFSKVDFQISLLTVTKSFCWNSYDVYCVFYIENDRKKREYSV